MRLKLGDYVLSVMVGSEARPAQAAPTPRGAGKESKRDLFDDSWFKGKPLGSAGPSRSRRPGAGLHPTGPHPRRSGGARPAAPAGPFRDRPAAARPARPREPAQAFALPRPRLAWPTAAGSATAAAPPNRLSQSRRAPRLRRRRRRPGIADRGRSPPARRSWKVRACRPPMPEAPMPRPLLRELGGRYRPWRAAWSSCWSCGRCSSRNCGLERTLIAAADNNPSKLTATAGEAVRWLVSRPRPGLPGAGPGDRRRDRRSEELPARLRPGDAAGAARPAAPVRPGRPRAGARRRLAPAIVWRPGGRKARFWELFKERYRDRRARPSSSSCAT